MPVRWNGPVATKGGYLEPAATCTDNPERGASTPKLADMTKKSIDLLKGNDKGFFLQVEGASIDKQDHAANPCGQIGETVDLDEATKVALDYAKDNRDTLVIVTADHAHSSQIVESMTAEDVQKAADDAKLPLQVEKDAIYPGLTRVLTGKDGQPLTVSYGTSDNLDAMDQGHTGTQVRIAAYGPSAANVVGLTDQTDLFFTISRALGLQGS
ncbi:alkaline phosphatase [Mycobacteroides abscessus subsp. abscessus]|nr:alkaline phosphatase [Mycobacteroides abscessus subsp. abscessus]